MSKKVRLWLAMATVLGAGVFAGVASAMPVLYSNSGGYVAGRYCANVQCAAQYWIQNGTAFHTICYADTVWQYVNYWSPRWFYGYYTLVGAFGNRYYTWVSASQTYYQVWTPHC